MDVIVLYGRALQHIDVPLSSKSDADFCASGAFSVLVTGVERTPFNTRTSSSPIIMVHNSFLYDCKNHLSFVRTLYETCEV